MDVETVKEAARLMKKASDLLSNGPLEFYLREMAATYELMMERFCPFKVGQRVQLAATPVITEKTSWGWMPYKHFIIKGHAGTVASASCGSDGFTFDVILDDQTWLDPTGTAHPVSKPSTFRFKENMLSPLPPAELARAADAGGKEG